MERYLPRKNLNTIAAILKKRYDKMKIRIIEVYKDSVILHGSNIHKTATLMSPTTMFHFPSERHALTQWKFLLRFCTKYSSIVIPLE